VGVERIEIRSNDLLHVGSGKCWNVEKRIHGRAQSLAGLDINELLTRDVHMTSPSV
jgi:hypothetical protein